MMFHMQLPSDDGECSRPPHVVCDTDDTGSVLPTPKISPSGVIGGPLMSDVTAAAVHPQPTPPDDCCDDTGSFVPALDMLADSDSDNDDDSSDCTASTAALDLCASTSDDKLMHALAVDNAALPEVMPGVHLGSRRDVSDAAAVARVGITAFVSIVQSIENAVPAHAPAGSIGLALQLPDKATTKLRDHMHRVNSFIDAARREGRRVVIYCERGVSRSVAFTAAYVLSQRATLTGLEALEHVRRAYPRADPNFAFINQLQDIGASRSS